MPIFRTAATSQNRWHDHSTLSDRTAKGSMIMGRHRNTMLLVGGLLLAGTTAGHAQVFGGTKEEVPPPPPPPPAAVEAPAAPAGDERHVWSLGLAGAGGIAMHSASFTGLPGVASCCPEYTGGTGAGMLFGLDALVPLNGKLSLTVLAGYQSASVTMETDEPTTVRVGSQAVQTSFHHTLEGSFGILTIEPAIEYRLGGLGLQAGLRTGLVMNGTYDQRETIADPSIPYTYDDGSEVNNASSGPINDLSGFQFGIVLGARYHVPIAGRLELVPHIAFAPFFTDMVTNVPWSVSTIRGGLSLLYAFTSRAATADPLRPGR